MVSRSSHPALSRVDNFAAGSTDVLLLAGRILMSYLFLSAGWGKLTNVVGTAAYFTALSVPAPSVMSYLVGALEVAVGVALILGLGTRYVAIVIFILCLSPQRSRIDTGPIQRKRKGHNLSSSPKISRS